MVSRVQQLALALIDAEGPLTAAQLAESIGVSSRTVRTELPGVGVELSARGARLVSRRNLGSYIEVTDEELFSRYCQELRIRASNIAIAGFDDANRELYICRRLVSSPKGVKVDELCEELCLSRSAIREPLSRARNFLRSYRLAVCQSAKRGVRVAGPEHLLRAAIAELFHVYVHEVSLPGDQRFLGWLGCSLDERQAIRHAYLKLQREQGWSLRDGMTQRIAMYLVIARRRRVEGRRVELPEHWVDELRGTPAFTLASRALSVVSSYYGDITFDDDEASFLAMLLLCSLDVDLTRDEGAMLPVAEADLDRASVEFVRRVARETGIDLGAVDSGPAMARQTLAPFVVAQRYGLDGRKRFDYARERSCLDSPLCTHLAISWERCACDALGFRCSASDVPAFASLVAWLLSGSGGELPLRPMRLLVVDGLGTEFARRKAEVLKCWFPNLIESIRCCELYEIRGFDPDRYDAVIHDSYLVKYRYEFPHAVMSFNGDPSELIDVHDSVLVNAFELEGLVMGEQHMRVLSDFSCASSSQFFRLVALAHTVTSSAYERMFKELEAEHSVLPSGSASQIAFVLAGCDAPELECLELYKPERAMRWSDGRVCAILFIRLDLTSGLSRIRAMERILNRIATHPGEAESLAKTASVPALRGCLLSLLRKSLEFAK